MLCKAAVFVAVSAFLAVASANLGNECLETSMLLSDFDFCKVFPTKRGVCDAGVYVSAGSRDAKSVRCRFANGKLGSLEHAEDGNGQLGALFTTCARLERLNGIPCDDTEALEEAGVELPKPFPYAIQHSVGGWDGPVGPENIEKVVGALDEDVPTSGKNLVYVTIGALNAGGFHHGSSLEECTAERLLAQRKPAFLAEAVKSGLFDTVLVEHFDSSSRGPVVSEGVSTRAVNAKFPLRINNRDDSEAMAALVPILQRVTSNGGTCVILEAVTQHNYPFPEELAVHAGCSMMRAYCQESADIKVKAPGRSERTVTSVSLADIGVEVPEDDLVVDAPVEIGKKNNLRVVEDDIEEVIEEAKPKVDEAIRAAKENGEDKVAVDLMVAEQEVVKAENEAEVLK